MYTGCKAPHAPVADRLDHATCGRVLGTKGDEPENEIYP